MIKLNFNTYQNRYNIEKPIRKPTQYVYETEDIIVLVYKNKEEIIEYTVVSKTDIIKFGTLFESDEKESIKGFKLNYCSDCITVEKFNFLDGEDLEPSEYNQNINLTPGRQIN